jgi:two-component sensor histidine kinase
MAILRDITEGKSAEQKIINSLREKEVLLKEIHHRVKNNLQVISSILNLQSNYVRDINTISILKECQSRIKSMAFIHELLYQNKDFNKIDFSEYVLVLAKNLIHSFGALDNRIKYKFEIDPVLLSLDTSIPCGLIVNELLTNALKYAFPNNKGGFIFVSLKRDSVGVKLTIKDNGVGLPPGLDYQNTESLGLQLVNTLVEQVSGSIEVFSSEDKGTAFSIVIKSENTEQNV